MLLEYCPVTVQHRMIATPSVDKQRQLVSDTLLHVPLWEACGNGEQKCFKECAQSLETNRTWKNILKNI